jgi:uncharacterized protein GlcG (DUF336 family)
MPNCNVLPRTDVRDFEAGLALCSPPGRHKASVRPHWEDFIMPAYLTRVGLAALGSVFACALVAPASAQTIARKDISAEAAMTIASTAIADCKAKGWNVSVAVVGRAGELIVHVRGNDTGPHTMDNSFRKAYTSRTTRQPSGEMAKRLKENPQLSLVTLPNMVAGEGALPIKVGDEVIGAAGASGAPGGEKDAACIQAGLDKIKDQLK